MKKKKSPDRTAVFLDRDGTINEDTGYIGHSDRVELIPRSAKAIRKLNKEDILTIIVSNQSGVGRGYMKKDDVALVDKKLKTQLARQKAHIDVTYYCYHHPDDNCSCRKPGPGMLKKAAKKFGLKLEECFVVGDKYTDILLGHNVGAKSVLVLTGRGRQEWEIERHQWKYQPDHVARDLYEAVKWILKQVKSRNLPRRHERQKARKGK